MKISPLLLLAQLVCLFLIISNAIAKESPAAECRPDAEHSALGTSCPGQPPQQDPQIRINNKFHTLPQESFEPITHLPPNTLLGTTTSTSANTQPQPSRYNIPGGESISLQYIQNFIPHTILTQLITLCNTRNGWTSSPQSLDGKSQVKATRTSRSCPLLWPQLYLPLREDPSYATKLQPILDELDVTWALTQRIASLLHVGEEYIEPFQLVRYLPGEFYKQHHDHGGYYGVETEQRPWTLLVFLSTVPSTLSDGGGEEGGGGYTLFKELGNANNDNDDGGIAIVPRMGDAVLWRNVHDETGQVLMDAVHEAVPPKDGGEVVKYAMNVWIADKKIKENMDVSAYRTK